MNNVRIGALAAMAMGLTFLAGCSNEGGGGGVDKGVYQIQYNQPAQVNIPEKVKRIAVAEFTGDNKRDTHYGDMAADKLASALDEYNRKFERYQLVDRKNLKKVLDERDFQLAISDSSSAVNAGKIAKVDAIIYGSVKIRQEDMPVTKTVPDFSGGRVGTKTQTHNKRVVTAVVSFSMDDIATSKTLAVKSVTETYDSDRDNKQKGFAGALQAMGMGNEGHLSADQAADTLIDRCVRQFVDMISPHEAKERLENSKSKLVMRGNKLACQGQYADALQVYRDALAEQPDDDAANYNAGLCCEATGNLKDAKEYYRKAMRINPDRTQYGRALNRVKDQDGAGEKNDKK